MIICKGKCNGCSACYSICMHHAIEMVQDERGFYIPQINKEKCIKCGLCQKVCPVNRNRRRDNNIIATYSFWSKFKTIRRESSSGGCFTMLAQSILADKDDTGVVYGVVWDESWRVIHNRIESIDELWKVRGSKYVQSYIGDTYLKVKTDLLNGRTVLFSGTGCQIDGLLRFLAIKYEKLYTVDVLCHGVGSPSVFERYLEYIQGGKKKGQIKKISFRYKKPSWSISSMRIIFDKGKYSKIVFNDPYMIGFSNNIFLRECCYECPYTSCNRVSDITMGDFWRYRSYKRGEENDQKGVSLITVNSEKGQVLLDKISDQGKLIEQNLDYAIEGNPSFLRPCKKSIHTDKFWDDFKSNSKFEILRSRYLMPQKESTKTHILRFVENYGHFAPSWMILTVKKMINMK